MKRNALLIFLLLVIIFIILYLSDYISPFIDPRYILLVVVAILGFLITSFGYLAIKGESFEDTVIEMIINFRLSSVFIILLGIFFIIISFLGFIYGPDWLGMEVFKRIK